MLLDATESQLVLVDYQERLMPAIFEGPAVLANARRLAEGLATMDGLSLNPEDMKTDIVFFKITRPGLTPQELTTRLAAVGVLVGPKAPDQIRAVTNYHVSSDDIGYALGVISRVLKT